MRAFRPVGDLYVAGLDPVERDVFATVVADVAELLGAGRFGDEADDAAADAADGAAADAADAADPAAVRPSALAMPRMSADAIPAPQDPAVRRLLPDASRDDDAVAAEFRRLTEADLRDTKVARLRDLWTALTGDAEPVPGAGIDDDDDLVVPRADAPALAAALTDVRLVLAERLGIESEEDADRLYETLEEQAEAQDAQDELGGTVDDGRPAREILAEEVRAYLGSVYAALTWLQESLMALLLADLGRAAD